MPCSFSGTHLVIMNSGFDNESTTKVNNNISNNSLKDKIMKKFVFAAIAAMVMVSVSNVFASSKMMGNFEVAPVDTVAPADSTVEGTAISSQASVENSAKQETPVENATESTEAKASETPVEQVENAQPTEEVKAQDAPVENTQQESTEQAVAE